MRAVINLSLLHGSNLKNPFIIQEDDGYTIKWEYQKTSYACQGEWSTYEVFYTKDNYDFDEAIRRLEDFIVSEYPYLAKGGKK